MARMRSDQSPWRDILFVYRFILLPTYIVNQLKVNTEMCGSGRLIRITIIAACVVSSSFEGQFRRGRLLVQLLLEVNTLFDHYVAIRFD